MHINPVLGWLPLNAMTSVVWYFSFLVMFSYWARAEDTTLYMSQCISLWADQRTYGLIGATYTMIYHLIASFWVPHTHNKLQFMMLFAMNAMSFLLCASFLLYWSYIVNILLFNQIRNGSGFYVSETNNKMTSQWQDLHCCFIVMHFRCSFKDWTTSHICLEMGLRM